MPFALNAWCGTKWHVRSGTPLVEGSLSKETRRTPHGKPDPVAAAYYFVPLGGLGD
ncbi:MAG: hypothetical protein ACR2HN_05270 [Tepidiformaceae bacterium]